MVGTPLLIIMFVIRNGANLGHSDFNYEYASDGSCQKVPDLPDPDHSLQCKENPDQTFYYEITGYRRIPLTTCQGGRELQSSKFPCPGHEEDFEKEKAKAGIGGFWLFILVVVLPITIASAGGYWVYRNWNGGMQVGSIRLGSGPSSGSGGAFDSEQPWIKYPVAAVAGVIAVVGAIPLLLGSVWRSVSGLWGGSRGRYSGLGGQPRTYTTRNSFARGRGDYAVVDPDEDELLGEDEDEDV